MRKRTSLQTDETVFAAVEKIVQQALADGGNPAEIRCSLAAAALRIGLDLAPSSGNAFGVRMGPVGDGTELRAAIRRCHSDPEFRALFVAHCRLQ
jgi:hypothetical protein